MGYFMAATIGELFFEGDKLLQRNTSFQFLDEVYISWQQPLAIPLPEGWIAFADNTLHVKPRQQKFITDSTTIRPKTKSIAGSQFSYSASVSLGTDRSLYHIVLPPFHLPASLTKDTPPFYVILHEDKLALGWISLETLRLSLVLERMSKEDFVQAAESLQEAVEVEQAQPTNGARNRYLATELRRKNKTFQQQQVASHLEQALTDNVPHEMQHQLGVLTRALSSLVLGDSSAESVRTRLSELPEIASVLQSVSGQRVSIDQSIVSFENSQTGDINIRDMAGRDVYSITLNLYTS